MNIQRMEQLAEFLEKLEPKRFNLQVWAGKDDHGLDGIDALEAAREAECGTVACVAGWAAHLAFLDKEFDSYDTGFTDTNKLPITVQAEARDWLELNAKESYALFLGWTHPEERTPADAAKAIRRLVMGDLDPWSVVRGAKTMNVVRMEQLADFLEQLEPEKFNLQFWVTSVVEGRRLPAVRAQLMDNPECGTTGCIAGWAAHLASKDPSYDESQEHQLELIVWRARRWLELTDGESDALFQPAHILDSEELTQQVNSRDAAEAVRRMISGVGRPWAVFKSGGI